MRILLTSFLLLFTILSNTFAQSEKKVIAVTPISGSLTKGGQAYANSLTEIIIDGIVKSNRFRVVDRSHFDHILTEENLQKGESFIDGLVVEQGKKLGAEYIVTGNLTNASADPRYRKETVNGKQRDVFAGYNAHVSFTLKVMDVRTGEIIASDVFDNRSGSIWIFDALYGNKEQAISQALKNGRRHVYGFIDKYFPLSMKIFEVAREKRGYAREVVITGGKEKGLKVGQWLKVVHLSRVTLDGKQVERKKPLGWIQVTSVDDENFSTCKVKRTGGDAIFQYYTSSPDNVLVLSGQGR